LFEFYHSYFLKLASTLPHKDDDDDKEGTSSSSSSKQSTPPPQENERSSKVSERLNYTEMKKRAAEKDWRHKYLYTQGIKEVMLVGGRHSGIGWVSSLIHLNAPTWRVVHASKRHHLFTNIRGADSGSGSGASSSGGVSLRRSNLMIDMNKVNSTLVLFVVEDPFTWIAAMHERHPHGAIASHAYKKHKNKKQRSGGGSSSSSSSSLSPPPKVTNPKHHAYKDSAGSGGRKKKNHQGLFELV
jgi:hypothetical protein